MTILNHSNNIEIFYYINFVAIFLTALAMSRHIHLKENIRAYRLQSFFIFVINLTLLLEHFSIHLLISAIIVLIFKVILFPSLLKSILEKLHIRDQFENIINIQVIFIIIGALTAFSFLLFPKEQLTQLPSLSYHAIPIALSISFIGLLLMINRSKTISQIISFLVIENGINLIILFGAHGFSAVLEFGLALDLLIGILIMGIFSNKIKRDLEHIDVSKLKQLKDNLR